MSSHPYVRLFPNSIDPTSSDDNTLGYETGDLWITPTKSWQCLDASTGAAVWLDLSAGGGGYTQEQIEDFVGAMVTGNTETGISVTYDDAGGKLDFDAQTAGDARYAPIAKGVTNGDSHDHNGGDGGTIAYSSLSGTPTIPTAGHVIYINTSPFTQRTKLTFTYSNNISGALSVSDDAGNDRTIVNVDIPNAETIQDMIASFLVAAAGITLTYNDVGNILSLDAQTPGDARYAPIAKGVTNGDTHDHNGGDGAQINHTTLSNIGTNSHATIDSTLAALASTYAAIANGVTNGDNHDHVGGDGKALTSFTPLVSNALNGTLSAGATQTLPFFSFALNASRVNMLVSHAGTLKNLYLRIGSSQPGTGSLVATVYVNNVATSLVLTIPASSGSGNYSETSTSVSVSAGDLVAVDIKNNASGTSATIGAMVLDLILNTSS